MTNFEAMMILEGAFPVEATPEKIAEAKRHLQGNGFVIYEPEKANRLRQKDLDQARMYADLDENWSGNR